MIAHEIYLCFQMGTGRCLVKDKSQPCKPGSTLGKPPPENALKMYICNFHGFHWFNFDK